MHVCIINWITISFNNAGNLPFVYVSAICRTPGLFKEPEKAVDTAIMYISVFLSTFAFLFWGGGFNYFRKPNSVKEKQSAQQPQSEEESKETQNFVETPHSVSSEIIIQELEDVTPTESSMDPLPSSGEKEPVKNLSKLRKCWNSFTWLVKKSHILDIFTPPTVGMLIGMIIGFIPGAKRFLITDPPIIIRAISNSILTFGNVSFPVSMVVLGANLYKTLTRKQPEDKSLTLAKKSGWRRVVIALKMLYRRMFQFNSFFGVLLGVTIKQLIVPAIGIGIAYGFVAAGIIPKSEPVLILVLIIEGAVPSAMNNSLLSSLKDYAVGEMSEILLYQYLISPFLLVAWSTLALHIACSLSGQCYASL